MWRERLKREVTERKSRLKGNRMLSEGARKVRGDKTVETDDEGDIEKE